MAEAAGHMPGARFVVVTVRNVGDRLRQWCPPVRWGQASTTLSRLRWEQGSTDPCGARSIVVPIRSVGARASTADLR